MQQENVKPRTGFPEWQQILITVACIFGCFGAIALLQFPQLQQLKTRGEDLSIEAIRRDLAAEQVQLDLLERTPSFGFRNLIANWSFLQFLQYFGDAEVRSRTDYRLSPEYFEVVVKKDPYFFLSYIFLSHSVSIYAGMPEETVALIDEGLTHMTPKVPLESPYIWRQKGVEELLFLGNPETAQESFSTAAEWALQSNLPNGERLAEASQQTAAFLERNPDSKTAQFISWSTVLQTAPDDLTRELAASEIEKLGGQVLENPDGSFQVIAPPED